MNSTNRETVECDFCGGAAVVVEEVVEHSFGRRQTRVNDEFIRCTECGEEYATADQMESTQMRAAKKIRREEGLLQPEEIRKIRNRYNLTQKDLEDLIGAGPKTVTRWENGTVFQNAATDTLLRVLRDFPEVVAHLARRRDVEVHLEGAFTVYRGTYQAAAQKQAFVDLEELSGRLAGSASSFMARSGGRLRAGESGIFADIPSDEWHGLVSGVLTEVETA